MPLEPTDFVFRDVPGSVENRMRRVIFPGGRIWVNGSTRQVTQAPSGESLEAEIENILTTDCHHPVENPYDLRQCLCGAIVCRQHSYSCSLCGYTYGLCCRTQTTVAVDGKQVVIPVCPRCKQANEMSRPMRLARAGIGMVQRTLGGTRSFILGRGA